MGNPIGWRNGNQVPFAEMSVPVWDLGVVAGASITEMARTYRHKAFRLSEHADRLLDSCIELQFATPYSKEELIAAAEAIVEQNAGLLKEADDLGIVMFITAGSNPTYLGAGSLPEPTVGIHTFRLPFELWKSAAAEGVRLSIPEARQISARSLPVHRKTRNRIHWWLADRQADAIEPGSKALLLDDDGHLTETSTACFYAVVDDTIVTPRRNVLKSMSRKLVEETAAVAGVAFNECDLSIEDVATFQEAFLSSTPSGILPVQSIDGVTLNEPPGTSVLPQLLAEWSKLAGLNPLEQILAAE